MSIFDPESMMFSTDWSSMEEGFKERARAAGYTGAAVYGYSETYSIDLNTELSETSKQMAYEEGKQISDMLDLVSRAIAADGMTNS